MSHEDFLALAEGYALGTLPESEARGFAAHLATCDECRRHVREISAVSEAMARALPVETPPGALRAQVLAYATSQPGAARRPSRAYLPWLTAAATVVAAVMSGTAWYYRGESLKARADQQATSERLQTLEQQIVRLQAEAATSAQTRSVLAARDLSRVELAGQDPAPAAAGRVFWSPSLGLVFAATNLPPLPPGRVYQLWVVADAPISAGLGAPTGTGDLSVVSTGVAAQGAKAFALTIEPEGGRPAPTGPMFLLGSLN